jgi:hypothetical protein
MPENLARERRENKSFSGHHLSATTLAMSAPTYIVQSYYQQGRKIVADQPRKVNSAEAAIGGAKRLAVRKAGVVAYSIVYEPESDVTGEPRILFKAGTLPLELENA